MNSNVYAAVRLAAVAVLAVALVGCGNKGTGPTPDAPADEVGKQRAKLTPEDKALVDAQEWCVISTDERLGSMGAPLKLTIKGEPVFVCCKGCVRKAEANPDATLTTLAELKAKAKARTP